MANRLIDVLLGFRVPGLRYAKSVGAAILPEPELDLGRLGFRDKTGIGFGA